MTAIVDPRHLRPPCDREGDTRLAVEYPATDYVREFAASIIGSGDLVSELPHDLSEAIFRCLTRRQELGVPQTGVQDDWERQFPDSQAREALCVPRLDMAVRTWVRRNRPGLWEERCRSRWPDGKRFALCLTHGVDFVTRYCVSTRDCWEVVRRILRASNGRAELAVPAARLMAKYLLHPFLAPSFRRDEYWHYEDWLKLEDSHGFKSTLFFLAGNLPSPRKWDTCYDHHSRILFDGRRMTVREMIREIGSRGWDIGLHGSYDSALDVAALIDEKRQIEDSCGEQVLGIRQHYLHYDVSITPRVQNEAGLRVDSTQGFTRVTGFRAGTSFPYFCWDPKEGRRLDVLEVPQHAMDGALFMDSALGYDTQTAVSHMLKLTDAVAEMGGCLTLNWHANWLNNPAYWDTYAALLSEAKSRNAWGCSIRQLYEWWLGRCA